VNTAAPQTVATATIGSDPIAQEIARYNTWRDRLTRAVNAYHDWLEANNQLDIQQSIRFYDLLEHLAKGRLMLAFLAEYSRGKSELINAMFFSAFKERLLPSDVGRTTMCPTELFHDSGEEPYLRLLPIETRYRDESIAQLKNQPVEWSKIRLNTSSAKEMREALKSLAQTKRVYALEARMMGFTPPEGENGQVVDDQMVEIPAWRYAMLNYPHPLLSNGLAVLDTPGLNALGMEPELTLNTVPNAHAVVFLLSIDTGVTKSDLEIWDRYVKPAIPQKIAVLNKIDLLWDDLKSQDEIAAGIARQIELTATTLNIPANSIFPISAQKALVAKVRGEPDLLERSGIERLESYLAERIIPVRRQILAKAVMNEIGAMMMASRASLQQRLAAKRAEAEEILSLAGKSKDVVARLWNKVHAERSAYNDALAEYKIAERSFNQKKASLMDLLNPSRLDFMLSTGRQSIDGSWTTVGLHHSMTSLISTLNREFDQIVNMGSDIKTMMDSVYKIFTERFSFVALNIQDLELDAHKRKLAQLQSETESFCRDPVNVMQPGGMMIKKFWRSLVERARDVFDEARTDCDVWLTSVTVPISTQMKDHKTSIESRISNLKDLTDRNANLEEKKRALETDQARLRQDSQMIDHLLLIVRQPFAPVPEQRTATDKPLETATTTLTKAVQLLTGRQRTIG
jgi:Dynamin family